MLTKFKVNSVDVSQAQNSENTTPKHCTSEAEQQRSAERPVRRAAGAAGEKAAACAAGETTVRAFGWAGAEGNVGKPRCW